ncbi:hypothetical protein [Arthrobacter sp. NPDC092385]|uniref:hypothetical protein n=1 Tax=Arthrobacter sp. NPDC092385 TaxID=3363943 RepID=UPI003826FA66
MRNVQQREIGASAAEVGVVLDSLADADDRVWPTEWPPIELDAGLRVGSKGGHGPIKYSVVEYEPGRRIRLEFSPGLGIRGYHEFLLEPVGDVRCSVTHTLQGPLSGRMRLLWPLMIRWVHKALIQDLFDNLERGSTGRLLNGPARWSPWVRFLRRISGAPPRSTLRRTGQG